MTHTTENPYAPPKSFGNQLTERVGLACVVALASALAAGVTFAWIDANTAWSEVQRLMFPMSIFGVAAAVTGAIQQAAARARLLAVPLASCAGFAITGSLWDLLRPTVWPPSNAVVLVVLLILSTLAGLIPIGGALVWAKRVSLRGGIRFAILGALLGVLSVVIVNTPTSIMSRTFSAFLCMFTWQLTMQLLLLNILRRHSVEDSPEQSPAADSDGALWI